MVSSTQQPAIFGDEEFCETVEKDEGGDCSDDKSGEDAEHEEDCGGPGVAVGQGSDDESGDPETGSDEHEDRGDFHLGSVYWFDIFFQANGKCL